MDEKISIIIPLYNKENYIEKCIESVLRQEYKNYELIVVDDGSSDSSLKKCLKYAESGAIKLITQKNSGESCARNVGIKIAKGDYIYFLDADDSIEKDMLKKMIDMIKKTDSDACALGKYTIYPGIQKEIYNAREAIDLLAQLRFPTSVWAYLYNKKIMENLAFDEDIFIFEDFLFNYLYLTKCQQVCIIYESLYHYEPNETSINRIPFGEKQMSELKIVNKIKEENVYISKYLECFEAHICLNLLLSLAKSSNIKQHKSDLIVLKKETKKILNKQKLMKKIKYMPLKNRTILFLEKNNFEMILWITKNVYYHNWSN